MQYTLADNNIVEKDLSGSFNTEDIVQIQYNQFLWNETRALVDISNFNPFFVGKLYVFDNTKVPLYLNEKFNGLKGKFLNSEFPHPSTWSYYRSHNKLDGFIIPFNIVSENRVIETPSVMTLATQYVNCPNPYLRDMQLAGISASRDYYRTIMLQGVENTATDGTFAGTSLRLIPHYPKVNTTEMFFQQNFITNYPSSATDGVSNQNGDEWEFIFEKTSSSGSLISRIYPYAPVWSVRYRLDVPYDYDKIRWMSTIYTVEDSELVPHTVEGIVAYFDECPADYYLMWVDRFGGIQCQGFYGKSQTSIDYKKVSTTSHKNLDSLIGVEYQQKFTINTGWLDEWKFPYYESIFVSPTLYLYDVKNDKGQWVTLSNNTYTEKKFINEKTQLNMELNLVAAEKKRISY